MCRLGKRYKQKGMYDGPAIDMFFKFFSQKKEKTKMHRTGRGITPRPVRGHKIALLVMLFCCLICVSARVERGALPDMLLKKMGNVIVCYADWSECDEKVFYLPLPPSLFLSLSPSLSPFLHPPVSLSCSHLSLSARTLSLLQKMLAVNK
jgi:hypothetical protein